MAKKQTVYDLAVEIIETYLADGTIGLGNLKTLIDAIPTTAMRGTDNAALASVLGALDTAAATGAVTNSDEAMAYIKQLVTELQALDVVADTTLANLMSVLVDYLAHGTWGLTALQTNLALVKTDTYNIHNNILSILVDYLSHGTWGLSPIKSQLAEVKTDTFNIHNNVLAVLQDYLIKMQSNLVRWGQIYAVNGNTFTSPHLTGLGIDAMPAGWYVYVMQADDAAPEGEYRLITDYADNGVVSHDAFSVALEVGDRVLLLHPSIAAIGERADAAAEGAVTTTDTMMAYIKQLVTAAIAEAASTARILCSMDFWSDTQEELQVDAGGGTETLPTVTVEDLPSTATIVRAIAMFKFRMVENVHAGANALEGAQHIQVQSDAPGTWRDAISLADNLCTFTEAAREGGDVWVGDHDIAVEVDENDGYTFQWVANADEEFIQFNDVQTGLRIWYSV